MLSLTLAGCMSPEAITQPPEIAKTPMGNKLRDFPPILNGKPVSVAVYSFTDKTGQRKPADNIANLSSAVTQGAEIYLIKA